MLLKAVMRIYLNKCLKTLITIKNHAINSVHNISRKMCHKIRKKQWKRKHFHFYIKKENWVFAKKSFYKLIFIFSLKMRFLCFETTIKNFRLASFWDLRILPYFDFSQQKNLSSLKSENRNKISVLTLFWLLLLKGSLIFLWRK